MTSNASSQSQSLISNKFEEWAHALSKKPLRKTKTTEMETPQQNSSTQSLEPEKKDENSPGTEGETPADASNSQEAADPDEILPVRPPEPSLSF